MRPLLLALALLASPLAAAPHNIVLFVADGLRGGMVTAATAPAMNALKTRGVWFRNSHSMFPTFTTANASALATGHGLGDTGDFSNTLYTGFPVLSSGGTLTPFIENDSILGELDSHFGGNYLNEDGVLELAHGAGYSTAVVGKLGPARILDHRGTGIVIDDNTGYDNGLFLPDSLVRRIEQAGLSPLAPPRGVNGLSGNGSTPGTLTANTGQQAWMMAVTTKAVLPALKASKKPFLLVYWSRDPDGTQHNQGDSLGQLTPGINGPTSLASIRNADDNLAQLEAALADQGLADTTDILVTSDHGFSVISKKSREARDGETELTSGFVALDLADALHLPINDPDTARTPLLPFARPSRGNALLGDPDHPSVVVAANGGSDLIYLPTHDVTLAARIVAVLQAKDYTSGVFVDDSLGPIPGTLPMSEIGLKGTAVTPVPAVVVGFRTFTTGGSPQCATPTNCQAEVADTPLSAGQGMHGSFGRGDTYNFMAAAGPDFRQGFVDEAPASNADFGATLARLAGASVSGPLAGRVLLEAMPGVAPRLAVTPIRLESTPGADGQRTMLTGQQLGTFRYYDAAGAPDRTVGLER